MPSIKFIQRDEQTGETQERALTVEAGTNLRTILLEHGISPHNGAATWFNCKGLGSCGTCAVEIEGPMPPKSRLEVWRTEMAPHHKGSPLRLACQCVVIGDITVTKHPGFWGDKVG